MTSRDRSGFNMAEPSKTRDFSSAIGIQLIKDGEAGFNWSNWA
jgi:hypothetical protein